MLLTFPAMPLSALYYAGLRMLGLPRAARELRNAAVVLCFHNVISDEQTSIGGPAVHMTRSLFRNHMRWLARNYTVIPLRELLARMRAGRSLRKTAAISFDDAYHGVFEYACPVLEEFRLPATVFVVSDAATTGEPFWWDHPAVAQQTGCPPSERWLRDLRGNGRTILQNVGVASPPTLPRAARPADWETIRAAVRGDLELGVHSATHRALPQLSNAELRAEVVDSREALALQTGVTASAFAYPYGLWDQRVRNAVHAAGYAMALTLSSRLIPPDNDPWAVPRVNVPARITPSAFEAWIAGWCPHGEPHS